MKLNAEKLVLRVVNNGIQKGSGKSIKAISELFANSYVKLILRRKIGESLENKWTDLFP